MEENKNGNETEKKLNENPQLHEQSVEEKTDANIESLASTLDVNLRNAEKEIADVGGSEGIKNTLQSMDSAKLKELQDKITMQEKSYAKTKRDLAFFTEVSVPLIALLRDDILGDKLKSFAASLFITGSGMGPLLVMTTGIKAIQEKLKLSLLKRKESKLSTLN
ncbi:MAG: hypothetical protein IPM92_02825 [Saprospiraceae bacterium]|nr:hypothetical protein [Saprospiraceae bacterium]